MNGKVGTKRSVTCCKTLVSGFGSLVEVNVVFMKTDQSRRKAVCKCIHLLYTLINTVSPVRSGSNVGLRSPGVQSVGQFLPKVPGAKTLIIAISATAAHRLPQKHGSVTGWHYF